MNSAETADGPLALRPSDGLAKLPPPLPPGAPVAHAPPVNMTVPVQAVAAAAAPAPFPPAGTGAAPNGGLPPARPSAAWNTSTAAWLAGGFALLAATGWAIERRRRRSLEVEKDSLLWADVQPPASSILTTVGNLDDILPDSPDPAESARSIYVTAIGETDSRREATLIDLHHLKHKLRRRSERGDNVSALLMLQQHLVDFRYTSPWVFLELRELYGRLDREKEWEVARDAFRKRFGQNAPAWSAPSTADAHLVDDAALSQELARLWPYRDARIFIVHWMLGEHEMRQRCSGPALLPLGVYRDLMMVDAVLDEVMELRTQPTDSLL